MFVLVVGGGKVGYYLSKELIEAGHEVVAPGEGHGARASRSPTRSARSSSPTTAARASTSARPAQPGRHRGRGHRRRRGQPRHLPDGQAPLRRPADDRPGQQPEERGAVPAPRRRRAHQPDPDDPRLDRAGHPGPRAAPPGAPSRGRARDHRGAPPGGLAGHRPGAGDLAIPEGCALFAVVRDGVATRSARTRSSTRATRSSRSAGRSARPCSTASSSATSRRPAPTARERWRRGGAAARRPAAHLSWRRLPRQTGPCRRQRGVERCTNS